jgi:hypothetical protein
VLVIPLLLGGGLLHGPAAAPSYAEPPEAQPTVESLPLAVQYALSRDLGRDDAPYHLASNAAGGYRATNPRTGLEATVTPFGMRVRVGSDTWSLSLVGWGRQGALHSGQALHPASAVGLENVQANGLELRRGALAERYVNGPLGLQQGWTLREPPPVPAEAPLTLAFTQSGSLGGKVDGDRRGLLLAGAGGAARWRYAGPRAYDATGRTLPAWLGADGERVLVQVDDADAVYPLEVNAWVQAAKLTASDGVDLDEFGKAVAVSGDGGTVVVGAGSSRGAVYVYTRPEGGWATTTAFTAKLTADDWVPGDKLGKAVAVSGDGGTVVAGAGSDKGAVYVYIRPATGWASTATFTAKLTASDAVGGDHLGKAVAVSREGDTVVAGAPDWGLRGGMFDTSSGAVYVYSRPATGWATTAAFTAKLQGSGAPGANEGYSVAVSGEGDTVAAGAPGEWPVFRGAVYVYSQPASGWATTSTPPAQLTAGDAADGDNLGKAVAVSGDGGTVVAGAGSNLGAVYVYSRPGTGWTSTDGFTAKLTASDGAPGDLLGKAVAVSGDGGAMVAGADSKVGVAYVYIRPETGWATTDAFTAKLTASDGADGDLLGEAVAVTGEGGTVVGGAPYNDAGGSDRGAAYVWAIPNTPPTPAFTVTPASGDTGTVFQFDASGCTDMEDPPSLLQVRWDWEDDGTYDTAWSPTKTISHSYVTTGTYTIRLEVTDSGGLRGSTTRQVTVGGQAPAQRVYLPLVVRQLP